MRTTVTIDDDVLGAARERAARERRSVGEVLSELARRGLTVGEPVGAEPNFHGFRPLPAPGRPVTNTLIDQLR